VRDWKVLSLRPPLRGALAFGDIPLKFISAPHTQQVNRDMITRRDFIKLCGSSSIGLILAACGVTLAPTETPAPTNTALPTSMVLPTSTPPPTATATLTNTPTPTNTATTTATPRPSETPTPRPAEIKVTADRKLVNEKGEVLKGAVITQFMYDYKDQYVRLRQARAALNTVKKLGVNAVSYVLNAGLFDDERYLSDLSTILKETNASGLPAILSLHSDGNTWPANGQTWTDPKQLITVDASLKDKWIKLLTNTRYGKDYINLTSAFILLQEAGPVSEPVTYKLLVRDLDWTLDLQHYIDTTIAIRKLTGKETPCSFAGGYWARRFEQLLKMDPAPLPSLMLNASPYYTDDARTQGAEFLDIVPQLRDKGWTPFVSEFGYKFVKKEKPEDVRKKVRIVQANDVAYFMWKMEDDVPLQEIFKAAQQ
jgi:hypothetical protein